jgi:glycosyltransferase involved in cell wall biosynthesis
MAPRFEWIEGDKKLKVLHITPFVFRPGMQGGGERYVQQLCSALVEIGVEARIVECKNFRKFAIYDGDSLILTSKNLVKLVKFCKKFDIIHVHHLNRETFTVAFVLSKLLGIPLVLSDHGGASRNLFRLLGRLRLRFVAAILAVSPWSLEDVDPDGVVKIHRVLWGGGNHLRTNTEVSFEKTDFLFLGRLLPHKGAHIAIEALPPNRRLTIAGEARDIHYLKELEKLAQGKDVVFLGSPDDSKLYSLYRSAQCVLMPSVSSYKEKIYKRPELLGIVALEALNAGVPVIGSDLGGLADLLRDSGQETFPQGDAVALQKKMETERFLQPSELVIKKYTWANAAKICLDGYLEVLK